MLGSPLSSRPPIHGHCAVLDAGVYEPSTFGADLFEQPQSPSVEHEQRSDETEDCRRGRPEQHEAARYQSVPLTCPPRVKILVVRQQDLPQQQTQSFSRSALELLPFLCEHSAEFADKLLRVIKDPSFDIHNVPWNSGKDLHRSIDTAQVWEYVPVYQETVPGYDAPVTFFANIRRDRHMLLQDMLNSPEANGMCLEAQPLFDGESRVYKDFASGTWLEQTQAAVRSGMCRFFFVLGLLFYSDAAEAKRKGHKFHPLSVYIANFPLDALRSQHGFRRIAHLPVLEHSDFTHLNTQQFTRLQRRLRHATYMLALQPFEEQSHSGFYMRCCDGRDRHFVPVPAAYVADIKEANEVFNIAPYPAFHPDIGTLIHKDKMSDPDFVAPPRTEQRIQEVLYEVKELQQTLLAQATALMKQYSMSIDQLTPLLGFAYVESTGCIVTIAYISPTEVLQRTSSGLCTPC